MNKVMRNYEVARNRVLGDTDSPRLEPLGFSWFIMDCDSFPNWPTVHSEDEVIDFTNQFKRLPSKYVSNV